MLMPDIINLLP